jgi:hypothetical protein
MHRQLGALREVVAALDPELHALLAARDATNYFFCYRWCANSGRSSCPASVLHSNAVLCSYCSVDL